MDVDCPLVDCRFMIMGHKLLFLVSLQEFEQNFQTAAFSQHKKVCDVLKFVSTV